MSRFPSGSHSGDRIVTSWLRPRSFVILDSTSVTATTGTLTVTSGCSQSFMKTNDPPSGDHLTGPPTFASMNVRSPPSESMISSSE